MSMTEKKLNDLFLTTLKDVYYAEKAILRALPKMSKAAESGDLKEAFLKHRDETAGHVERLEQIFGSLGKKASGKTCEAIKGIIEEGEEIMDDFEDSDALDAGLIAAGQAVEHYEISRYGTLRTWADQLGMREAAKLLDQTLAEEKKTDQLLTQLAEARANPKAHKAA
jgi:ferritin-like metal-binding protein YciE